MLAPVFNSHHKWNPDGADEVICPAGGGGGGRGCLPSLEGSRSARSCRPVLPSRKESTNWQWSSPKPDWSPMLWNLPARWNKQKSSVVGGTRQVRVGVGVGQAHRWACRSGRSCSAASCTAGRPQTCGTRCAWRTACRDSPSGSRWWTGTGSRWRPSLQRSKR